MTEEEKQLLLIDLCARLPYNDYKVQIKEEEDDVPRISKLVPSYIDDIKYCSIASIKVYLRPLSSMTEEQKQLVRWFKSDIKTQGAIDLYMNRYIEWLDSRHFDWRTDGNGKTLIEKGLALEAPKEMYNI